ncbi:hypothetical protein [Nocardioides pakistanensis]
MTDEHDDDSEARLDEAMRILDALPPEIVKQAILDMGGTEIALDVLKEIATTSDDVEAREEARRYIKENGLGVLLLSEDDEPDAGQS